jgi:hypothetical protein
MEIDLQFQVNQDVTLMLYFKRTEKSETSITDYLNVNKHKCMFNVQGKFKPW